MKDWRKRNPWWPRLAWAVGVMLLFTWFAIDVSTGNANNSQIAQCEKTNIPRVANIKLYNLLIRHADGPAEAAGIAKLRHTIIQRYQPVALYPHAAKLSDRVILDCNRIYPDPWFGPA